MVHQNTAARNQNWSIAPAWMSWLLAMNLVKKNIETLKGTSRTVEVQGGLIDREFEARSSILIKGAESYIWDDCLVGTATPNVIISCICWQNDCSCLGEGGKRKNNNTEQIIRNVRQEYKTGRGGCVWNITAILAAQAVMITRFLGKSRDLEFTNKVMINNALIPWN